MDNTEKKRLANEKRLKAIQEWQKIRNQNVMKIPKDSFKNSELSPPNKRVKLYNIEDVQNSTDDKLKLFESDEEVEEDLSNCFKIRPQFEGKNGLRALEMSSDLSDRFKLDERFRDEENITEQGEEEDSEKNKNIRILESILGHEVSKRHPVDVHLKRKKEIQRFDPEAESSANFIKPVGTVLKKAHKKTKKTEPSATNEEIPISSERYIEVSSNLKDIISSGGTFSFSEKFNANKDTEDKEEEFISSNTDILNDNDPNKEVASTNFTDTNKKYEDTYHTNFIDPFFISDTDERLKEGIEFFMRPKPLDDIRNEWLMKRDQVLDIFKRRKRSAQRFSARNPKKNQAQKRQFFQRKKYE